MPAYAGARLAALACLLVPPLTACVAASANSSASRATELAHLISRSVACKAGYPRANTLERFLADEQARGATPEQLAGARSTYVTLSEAATINQDARPEACTSEERSLLKPRMARIRAGDFGGL